MTSYLGSANTREGRVTLAKVEADPRRFLDVGDSILVKLPWSEVCMHLGMADKLSIVRLESPNSAQLLDSAGMPYSFPITPGEAGIYRDRKTGRFYTY